MHPHFCRSSPRSCSEATLQDTPRIYTCLKHFKRCIFAAIEILGSMYITIYPLEKLPLPSIESLFHLLIMYLRVIHTVQRNIKRKKSILDEKGG